MWPSLAVQKILENLRTDITWQLDQFYPPITRSQEEDIVSASKKIIETHVSARLYLNYPKRKIEETTTIVHYTTEIMSNITAKNINQHTAGFQLLYQTVLSNGTNLDYPSKTVHEYKTGSICGGRNIFNL